MFAMGVHSLSIRSYRNRLDLSNSIYIFLLKPVAIKLSVNLRNNTTVILNKGVSPLSLKTKNCYTVEKKYP